MAIEEDITAASDKRNPAEYVDCMLALGWLPYLVIHGDGRTQLIERYPDRADIDAVALGHELSAYWTATEERRAAIKTALTARGLAFNASDSKVHGGYRNAA